MIRSKCSCNACCFGTLTTVVLTLILALLEFLSLQSVLKNLTNFVIDRSMTWYFSP